MTSRSPLRDRLLMVAAGLVALHVVDDNYLQPAPGTSRADHLVSGLVPVALLGVAVWCYRRVRAGAQATIAITLGVFGLIVGALEAGFHTLEVGPTGDDFTGLLAIPAGVVLIGVGVVTLWTSRRRTPNPWWRHARRLLLVSAAALALDQLALPVGVAYMATHSLPAVVNSPHLGAATEDVTLHTSDGLSLAGWYVPSRNGAAVIVFPGRSGTQGHARMLVEHGYGVLLFDRRGEGASEGDGNLFGWGGERDIYAALDYLERRPDVDPGRIGGIGLSVGGELMLQAAANDDRLAAVVSDGAGTRSLSEELEELDAKTLAANLPLLAVKTAAVSIFANRTPPPELTDLVPEIAPRPTLFIWASKLSAVETMNPTYHRLAGPTSSIWELDDARHVRGLATHPEEYERRVVAFLDTALLGGP